MMRRWLIQRSTNSDEGNDSGKADWILLGDQAEVLKNLTFRRDDQRWKNISESNIKENKILSQVK